MTDDRLVSLRKRADLHADGARARPLMELAAELMERYWRAGPGSPGARPYLDEGIDVLGEAHRYLETGSFLRAQVAGQLGWLLGIRHTVDFGPEQDRERAMPLLEEALEFPQLPKIPQTVCRLTLGQLLVSRLLRHLQSSDFLMRVVTSGLSSAEMNNADRAAGYFRTVLDEPAASSEVTAMAQTMLDLTDAFRQMFTRTGGSGGLDLGRAMQAMKSLQDLQQTAAARPQGFGYGYQPNPFHFEADDIARRDPLERPVGVVDGTAHEVPTAHPARPKAPAPLPATTFRTAFLEKLSNANFVGLLTLLEGSNALAVDTVDDLVALGSSLVEAPEAVGTDHLLFAVALYLRAILEGEGGWGPGGGGADDTRAAAESLLAVGDALSAEPADAVVLAFRLAHRLDTDRPDLDSGSRLADRFGDVTQALRGVGADGLLYSSSEFLLLLSTATGQFTFEPSGSPLPARLLVVAKDPIPDQTTVSYVRSAAQLVELAMRSSRRLAEKAVFVSNPRRDRQQATVDALMLRRTFYPGSTGLGETVENVNGVGSADEVCKNLDASLLQLGCGITPDGGLELAGSDVLDAAEIGAADPPAAGGVAVLPPITKGAAALIEAFMAAGFAGVIAFRNEVPDRVASLVYFLLHAHMVDEKLDPAAAVAAVRRWMADPGRQPVADLPSLYDGAATTVELADPAIWGALTHYGVSRPCAV